MRSTLLALPLLVGGACAAQPDPAPTPNVVFHAPDLGYFAYRDGDGAWQTATPDAAGDYHLSVTDDYAVITGCRDAHGVVTGMQLLMRDESPVGATCAVPTAIAPSPRPSFDGAHVKVTGKMKQVGTVALRGVAEKHAVADYDFTLDVAPGVQDLIAYDDARVLVKRDLDIEADTRLEPIDVEEDGVPFAAQPLHVDDNQNAAVRAALTWSTPSTSVTLAAVGDTLVQPPASLIADGDELRVSAETSDATHDRWIAQPYAAGTPVRIFLPARIDARFVDDAHAIGARLGAFPAADLTIASAQTVDGQLQRQYVVASKSWLIATFPASIAFDTSAPGFADAWSIDLSPARTESIFAGEVTAQSAWSSTSTEVSP
jgi:hypothetical protein